MAARQADDPPAHRGEQATDVEVGRRPRAASALAPAVQINGPGDHFDDFEIKELVCFFKQSA